MPTHPWVGEAAAAITVCDQEGIILEMNDKAARSFEAYGGKSLIGRNVFDCHQPTSRAKLKQLMERGETNVYTIEKKGVKKLVHQSPWYEGGVCRGFMEIVLEIPHQMEHFVRS